MAKLEITRNYLERLNSKHGVHVFNVPYRGLQFLLGHFSPDYYSSSEFGWDFDAYLFKDRNVVICTGYRDFPGEEVPDEIYRFYNRKARGLYLGYTNGSFDSILNEFLDKVLEWAGE